MKTTKEQRETWRKEYWHQREPDKRALLDDLDEAEARAERAEHQMHGSGRRTSSSPGGSGQARFRRCTAFSQGGLARTGHAATGNRSIAQMTIKKVWLVQEAADPAIAFVCASKKAADKIARRLEKALISHLRLLHEWELLP